MPEPRCIHMGGEMFVGFEDGRSEAYSEYGHRPWQKDYKNDRRYARESASLRKFQAEFAVMHGKAWRGWSYDYNKRAPPSDSDDDQSYFAAVTRKTGAKRRPGGGR
jgi:hypothetical protein